MIAVMLFGETGIAQCGCVLKKQILVTSCDPSFVSVLKGLSKNKIFLQKLATNLRENRNFKCYPSNI